jgi:acyl-CoA thioester hydrolase
MNEYRFAHRIDVRFRDCDSMGHVNNAVYFTYMEQTRFAYWRELLRARGGAPPGMILARAECDFRSPAVFGETVEVRMRAVSIGRSSFAAQYEIVNARDRRVLAEARSVQVMYDYQQSRSIPLPDDIRERIESFEGGPLPRKTRAEVRQDP